MIVDEQNNRNTYKDKKYSSKELDALTAITVGVPVLGVSHSGHAGADEGGLHFIPMVREVNQAQEPIERE